MRSDHKPRFQIQTEIRPLHIQAPHDSGSHSEEIIIGIQIQSPSPQSGIIPMSSYAAHLTAPEHIAHHFTTEFSGKTLSTDRC